MVSLGKRDSSVSPVPRRGLVCGQRLAGGHTGRAEIYATGFQMPGFILAPSILPLTSLYAPPWLHTQPLSNETSWSYPAWQHPFKSHGTFLS